MATYLFTNYLKFFLLKLKVMCVMCVFDVIGRAAPILHLPPFLPQPTASSKDGNQNKNQLFAKLTHKNTFKKFKNQA